MDAGLVDAGLVADSSLGGPADHVDAGVELLQQRCPHLGALVAQTDRYRLAPMTATDEGYFAALVHIVIGQQISTVAADRIHDRLVASLDGLVTPSHIVSRSVAHLRAAGLSTAKARTLQGLASAHLAGELPLAELAEATDDEVVRALSAIWGIGRWTAEMFLMFTMGRHDVWPVGDLAVRRGWAIVHDLPAVPTAAELDPVGEQFRPYRSVAAWYCWRVLEPVEAW